ncbi:lasso peptide biosynthesis B2 protein [Massilia sp. YIM B02443]|uniref:lasso peptide biosynthesis B2 protein n=1 Tax=Massilia sp. YIM B02443 TaxID=3050127 RepID=UPI0025B6C7D5|nr:lasso peptide biosynthesis B2 protein [Massilia sp. YIM B02443]
MSAPGGHLLWRALGDLVYVLNVRDGRYAGLSGRDAERWVQSYGAARTTRATPAPAGASAARPPAWGRLAPRLLAWQVNRRVRRLLADGRFEALYALAESMAPASTPAPARTPEPPQVLRAFLQAELLFANRNPDRDCLVRSFSLFLFLRALGFAAVHRIGFRACPFDAHAWVELDGAAILERGAAMDRWHGISIIGQAHDPVAAAA